MMMKSPQEIKFKRRDNKEWESAVNEDHLLLKLRGDMAESIVRPWNGFCRHVIHAIRYTFSGRYRSIVQDCLKQKGL